MIGRGCGKDRGLDRGKTLHIDTAWSEVVTVLVVVIFMLLLLTY
jgi:hypothetical protein